MAKIIEDVIIIKVSRIVKDGGASAQLDLSEVLTTLESVAQELVGDGAVVEATVA